MRSFFVSLSNPEPNEPPASENSEVFSGGYLSDLSDDAETTEESSEDDLDDRVNTPLFNEPRPAPSVKRQRHIVPVRVAHARAKEDKRKELEIALQDIEKVIASKRRTFMAGPSVLQAYRARAIQSYLWMVIHNKRKGIDASERAAESQGFAARWGGRMVRHWVRQWLKSRNLPESRRGKHTKTFTPLDDPAICTELRSYVRSNKWSMNPEKLVNFTKDNTIDEALRKHMRHVVDNEIPRGLQKYLEVELFPRIQLKVTKGISIHTARRWLHREGFQYTEHKKSLYFDGHERPDVVAYW